MPFYRIEGRGKDSGRKRKREFCAPNRAAAEKHSTKNGTTPDTIEEQPYWHLCVSVAGATHKNPDNTSRQKIISKCRRGERLRLHHEVGNKHDKHATQVCLPSGEIVGYLPGYVASDFVECWHNVPGGCTYSATVLRPEPLSDDRALLTLQILVFVALTSADSNQVAEYVAHTAATFGSDLIPATLMPTEMLLSQQRPAYRPAVDKSTKGGCLGVIIVFAIVVAAIKLI